MKKIEIEGLKEAILNTEKSIVITAHRGPDGDAMGSSLGLFHAFRNLGKKVDVVMPTTYPNFLKWMPGDTEVVNFETDQEEATQLLNDAGFIFCLDFNAISRVQPMSDLLAESKAKKVMIDHHLEPEDFPDFIWSDVTACSTAQLIYEFLNELEWTELIDTDAATCLYVGILTDTGSFRFPSTTPLTHRIVAELLDRGANNSEIYNSLFDENRFGKLQLLGYCLSEKLVHIPKYNTSYVSLTLEELARFGFEKGDTEGIVNYALSVKDTKLAAIFIESEEIIKISLRSKGVFSVNDLSRNHFFGGGHTNAAGGKSDLNLADTVKKFESLLENYSSDLC